MNQFATALTLLLEGWWTRLVGAGGTAFGPVTWTDVIVMASFLVAALIASGVVALVVRHFAAKPPEGSRSRLLQQGLALALGKPVYVLLWACGLYLAATPIILAVGPGGVSEAVRGLTRTVFDLGVFVIVFWFVFRITGVLGARLVHWTSRTGNTLDDLVVPLVTRSLRIALPVLGIILALPLLHLPPRFDAVVARCTSILLIGTLAAILFQAVRVAEAGVLARFDISAADNLRARKVHTQVGIIVKVADVIIALFTIASVLMLFDEVRRLGTSLLASAGVVGIIVGFAAQKTVANLLAGFQIALTQPIREDDVLVVEGEWGRVEEITLTYVVVHIWDDRRLVLPLSYFIDKPFQNWTRASANRLGTVYIWVDYTFPVEEGRKVLKGIIEGNPLWDGRFWNLVVSDATERTMQLRVLATAKDSSTEWDLRCDIRERFIAFIRKQHPASLPQLRTQLPGAAGALA